MEHPVLTLDFGAALGKKASTTWTTWRTPNDALTITLDKLLKSQEEEEKEGASSSSKRKNEDDDDYSWNFKYIYYDPTMPALLLEDEAKEGKKKKKKKKKEAGATAIPATPGAAGDKDSEMAEQISTDLAAMEVEDDNNNVPNAVNKEEQKMEREIKKARKLIKAPEIEITSAPQEEAKEVSPTPPPPTTTTTEPTTTSSPIIKAPKEKEDPWAKTVYNSNNKMDYFDDMDW